MRKVIMVGCDLHEKSMVLKLAEGRESAETVSLSNDRRGRRKLIAWLSQRSQQAGGAAVIFAYEASGLGFGLYDELREAGFPCYVLAPTKIARSTQHRRRKTDERDAQEILDLLRAHVLAGNALPTVWVPDPETRDHRELVRLRLEVGEKTSALKAQIQALLKRHELRRPSATGKGWTQGFREWLEQLLREDAPLGVGGRAALASLLRQLRMLEQEVTQLDRQLVVLAGQPRYAPAVRAMTQLAGVGVLSAMVFLTEMGTLSRFRNRRQIGAYLGLVPSSHESGQRTDRKGHITRQGSSRVRRVLCQATWARVRTDPLEQRAYARLVARNPKQKKIAVVASMRRLAVRLWHRGREAQAQPETARTRHAAWWDFLRHGSGVREGQTKRRPPATRRCRRPAPLSAHPRLGYPLSGCVPAEPDSVSPSRASIAAGPRPCRHDGS